MPWRGHTASHCKRCGRPVKECGPLSARYLCQECGEAAAISNHRAMRARAGDEFLRWRRSMAAAVGAVLVQDLEDEPTDVDSPA